MKSIANDVTGQSMSRTSDMFPQGYSRPSAGSMCVRDCGLKSEHSGLCFDRHSAARKPATANPNEGTPGTPPVGKNKKVRAMTPAQAQDVEDRVQSGHRDRHLKSAKISEFS
jgi:hypothetical protein